MSLGLLGKKVGMTQLFDKNGEVIPISIIQAGPCSVVQIKTPKRDGYCAVQLGYIDVKEERLSRPMSGHFKKNTISPKRILREFRLNGESVDEISPGQIVDVSIFKDVKSVDVRGISKGKGFAGVMKRHGFHGGPASHGSTSYRKPGSIGSAAFPARVFKGHKLPGRMGGGQVTVQDLMLVEVDVENNLLLVKGAVPGRKNTILSIKKAVKNK